MELKVLIGSGEVLVDRKRPKKKTTKRQATFKFVSDLSAAKASWKVVKKHKRH